MSSKLAYAHPGAAEITKLLTVGRKLAVLGIEVNMLEGQPAPDMRHWHVVKAGSYNVPQMGSKLAIATAECGRTVATNGYAADWKPPDGAMCPACAERV